MISSVNFVFIKSFISMFLILKVVLIDNFDVLCFFGLLV